MSDSEDKGPSLEAIRAIAEEYVKENLPDEYPYFDLVWDRIVEQVPHQPTEKNFLSSLVSGAKLAFADERRLALVSPTVILTLIAVLGEIPNSIPPPSEETLVRAIEAAAPILGMKSKLVPEFARKVAPHILKDHISVSKTSLESELEATLVSQHTPPHLPAEDTSSENRQLPDQLKKAISEVLAPCFERFDKAALVAAPPTERKWCQHLKSAYRREQGPTGIAKWRAVAHIVVAGAIGESRKQQQDRHSDYLTQRMLGTLIDKLNAPGASRTKIEAEYADILRRYAARGK